MNRHRIPFSKINLLRQLFFKGEFNKVEAAKTLNLSRKTVTNYVAEFRRIKAAYPKKLSDETFFMPVDIAAHRPTELYVELLAVIPEVLRQLEGQKLSATNAFKLYKLLCPEGYSFSPFKDNFFQWCTDNDISRQRLYVFPPEDLATLEAWRKGNDHWHWQIAVALLESAARKPVTAIAAKVEVCKETLIKWLKLYRTNGLSSFVRTHVICDEKLSYIKARQDNLIHLLHQHPSIFNLNRTSWKLDDLVEIYYQEYGIPMNIALASRDLRKRGYYIKSARELLVSPDPLYREKYEAVQDILRNLGPNERFFSIDEYGPVSIKIKGGRTYTKKGETKSYPQLQDSKGWLICTAALELAKNQVTHFYSLKKNTEEMIKLLDILLVQYQDQEKLYLSWDAASWHASNKLKNYIAMLNSAAYHQTHTIPQVALAPLPASAQFLNVIESVFSGLARAVIQNSDYPSTKACKTAIDRHFQDRNAHFLAHPHRAGNKIWGGELTLPEFDKANRCKTATSLLSKVKI